MIKEIRAFVATCPYLQDGAVRVDFLDSAPVCYSVDPVPTDSIISKDVTGATVRQYAFAFSSQEAYGIDVLNNMQNSEFFEKFAAWLEEKTAADQFPNLGTGKKVNRIYAAGLGFLIQSTEDSGVYQIQCNLIYEQEV
jgi:hypothetical protein